MPKQWHDINDPGSLLAARRESPESESAESDAPIAVAKQTESEIRFVEGTWLEGENGFAFNDTCFAQVKADLLKKDARRRFRIRVFVIFDGEEEDIRQEVEGRLEDDGAAKIEVKLFYGEKYFDALRTNPAATCSYKFKAIHPAAEEFGSQLLEMPHVDTLEVDFVEVPDILFNHASAIPVLDENGWLIESAVSAFSFAAANASKELVIFGHTDTSGGDAGNFELSKERSLAYKAVLQNDTSAWKTIAAQKSKTECYQRILKTLTTRHGWSCDPGEVDNDDGPKTKDAIRNFQKSYNQQFSKSIPTDGAMGPKTWEAFLQVYRSIIDTQVKSKTGSDTPVAFVWGYKGEGVYPCGEGLPLENPGQNGYRSETNRRVELVFYDPGEISGDLHTPTPESKYDIAHCPITGKPWTKKKIDAEAPPPAGAEPGADFIKLDKWFIPGPLDKGGEACTIKFRLEGDSSRVDKLSLDVFASNYCKAELNAKGEYSFPAKLEDTPVYSKDLTSMIASEIELSDWNGTVTATEGALKSPEGGKGFINAAFSPYTVHLRHYKADADNKAAVDIADFWPRWDRDKNIVHESLKVVWTVKKCERLKKGKLAIVDKADTPVFAKDLSEADLTQGAHEFTWDGSVESGGKIAPEQMPYRIKLSASTAPDDANGIALAAMQTEVRLFVHPDTGKDPAKPWLDPNSLEFSLAPFAPRVPDENAEEEMWYQCRLAEAGYHPGPVNGTTTDETKLALKEFQRSVAKNDAKPFARLSVTGNRDADSKAALKRTAADARPFFGRPNNLTDLTRAQASELIAKKDESVVVWIDDRHTYTENGVGSFFMGDYHGDMSIGDGRIGRDSISIARPCIPLQVSMPLLSKTHEYAGTNGAAITEASQSAVGPLRCDFSFREVGPDFSVIDTAHANYDKTRIRTRTWMEKSSDALSKTEGGVKYTNAPEKIGGNDAGGIRPDNLAGYYKKVFALDDTSLLPWRACDNAAARSVSTRAHAFVGQESARYFEKNRGKAGIFFNPSRAAGDGYQCRAELRFDGGPAALGAFPNSDVLARRYPKLPQARTSNFRLWRKGSYRGYACWAPAAEKHWPAFVSPCTEFYKGAHLHFVHEGPDPASAHEFAVNNLITQADYTTAINATVTSAQYAGLTITLNVEKVWPYTTEKRLGIPRSAPGTTIASFYADVLDGVFDATWRRFRKEVLHLLMKKVEENEGLLRGFFLVEFKSSDQVNLQQYACGTCAQTMVEVTNNCAPGDLLTGTACPACGGILAATANSSYASIPLPAVGVSMGGTWLFTTGGPDVWAHELGHIRHLEHSRSRPGSASPAPGGKVSQHDTEVNPDAALAAQPAKDKCWDRRCIMSYNHAEKLFFCGKCLKKNSGIAVENIANPAGNLHE